MREVLLIMLISLSLTVYSQKREGKQSIEKMTPGMTEVWSLQPAVVTPGEVDKDTPSLSAPSDAIVLFDGTDLSAWESAPSKQVLVEGKDTSMFRHSEGGEARWKIKDGVLIVNKQVGDIQTKQKFRDFQLHIEWRIPEDIHGEGQYRGNSGIFLQGIYELQVLDSYRNKTYANGQAGSIYKQTAPMVNAMRPPGEWNVYNILYTAPTFRADGSYRTRPKVTVLHNGILIQYNTLIIGTTPYIGLPQVKPHGKGPIRLQAHGDESEPISFRNIWVREL